MAKQNVTFIERHVEKIVVGVTGAVLLGTLALYGISSPNTVDVGGTPVGPTAFYNELRTAAGSGRDRIRNGSVDPIPPIVRLPTTDEKGPFDRIGPMAKLAPAPTFLPPSVPIPAADAVGSAGQIELARILPPKSITVSEGRSEGTIPRAQVVRLSPGSSGASESEIDSNPSPRDYVWATITAGIDRAAQKAIFEAAKYDAGRAQLIVAKVQAERQTLQPNGQWGPAEIVLNYYAPKHTLAVGEIKPVEQDGQKIFSPADRNFVQSYRQVLYTPEAQAELLRPPFQDAGLKSPLAWSPPRQLAGFNNLKLKDFGVKFPLEINGKIQVSEQAAGPGPRPAGAGQTAAALERERKKQVQELLTQADNYIKQKKFIKASECYDRALGMGEALTDAQRKSITDQRAAIDRDVALETARLKLEEEANSKAGIVILGEEQEPLWVTDLSVVPGRSYRYRLRVVAFNEYAGVLGQLKNAVDAERVLVEGEWSDWSEPITITPIVQVFFTDVRQPAGGSGTQSARMMVYQWTRGEWGSIQKEFQIGEKIVAKTTARAAEANYDGVVVSIDSGKPYRQRAKSGIAEEAVPTDVVTLVSAQGDVEERYAVEDKTRSRAFAELVKRDKDLANAEMEEGGGFGRGGPMMGPSPRRNMGPEFGPPGRGGPMDGGRRRAPRLGPE